MVFEDWEDQILATTISSIRIIGKFLSEQLFCFQEVACKRPCVTFHLSVVNDSFACRMWYKLYIGVKLKKRQIFN